jgi:hypothetical protein
MLFLSLIFALFITAKPLLCSSDEPAPTSAPERRVPLSRIIAPFAKIRINQNGIIVPALEGITHCDIHDKEYKEYILNDYTYTDSSEFTIENQSREMVLISDPQNEYCMPILLHHKTGTYLYTGVDLHRPNNDSPIDYIDYHIQSHQPIDRSFMKIQCIVLSDETVNYQGRVRCENTLTLRGPLENPLFKNLHSLTLVAQRLAGHGALLTLCIHLPKLVRLDISNTKFEDTRLTLVHDTLERCKIEKCGIDKIGSVIAPKLVFLSLRFNKLRRFDIHTLDLQPCTINLRDNKIVRVCKDEEPTWPFPQSYLYLQGNPDLDKKATYQALFKKEMPENDTDRLDRSNNTLLLDHNDFAFHTNGVVENYRKPEAEQL